MAFVAAFVALTFCPLSHAAIQGADFALYLGGVLPQDTSVSVTDHESGGVNDRQTASFQLGWNGGIASHLWFGQSWGLFADIGYLKARSSELEVEAVPFACGGIYQWHPSESFPVLGGTQPYIGIGFNAFFYTARADLRPEVPESKRAISLEPELGFDFRSGIKWSLKSNFGLYLQYRFLYTELDFEGEDILFGDPSHDISTSLPIHFLTLGLFFN